ncbi:MAG TPA: vWA domain-containing protein [Candidatus Elarobacter sp.]|jgi:hypothetical protein|nr:vWA domain-containing protein [Candidatus Elarobacter sp.]
MPYTAEISRRNPAYFIILIDQSLSMEDPLGDGTGAKARVVADTVNRLLQNIAIQCSKDGSIWDYFYVSVLGYGLSVGSAFSGDLGREDCAPISAIALHPARIEERTKRIADGTGGFKTQSVKFPVWFDAVAGGGTPMCEALAAARDYCAAWAAEFPHSFPPIVLNVTDGESTDPGNPIEYAHAVRAISVDDGGTLLFNLHLSSKRAAPVLYPAVADDLPDKFSRQLFEMSSPLPPPMIASAVSMGIPARAGSRGFVFNAPFEQLVNFLEIGTRLGVVSGLR